MGVRSKSRIFPFYVPPRRQPPKPLDPELFLKAVRTAPRGGAAGPSGWRLEDYTLVGKYHMVPDATASSTLYKVAQAIYEGKVPAAFQPYWAGGRLIALTKPNGKLRPIVVGEALRRLVGSAVSRMHKSEAAVYFAPARNQGDVGEGQIAQAVQAAQLGVGTQGGLEEIVHTVTIALQCHPFSLNPAPNLNTDSDSDNDGDNDSDSLPSRKRNPTSEGWVCISVDFRNFFNTISRPAIFRTLLDNPQFLDMYPLLSQLYSKESPGRLWADLGGDDWDDILSKEGVHQGCSFGSFLASLGLQPVLQKVASKMSCGSVSAYCDDVKICAPTKVALEAYNTLTRLAKELLGIDEVPSKGSIMWEGEGSPDLSKFPLLMPGVRTRITHDRHLGVFIGDSRPASVRAVKDALMEKFTEKAHLISRLSILSDPQVKFNLLRCCASTRPGFWLRTMSPDLTLEAAEWYDCQLRASLSGIVGQLTDESWSLFTKPAHLSGRGVISACRQHSPCCPLCVLVCLLCQHLTVFPLCRPTHRY